MPEIVMKATQDVLDKLRGYDFARMGRDLISDVELAFGIQGENDVVFDVEKTFFTTGESVKIRISHTVGEDEYNRGKPFELGDEEKEKLEKAIKKTLKKHLSGVTDNIFVWITPVRESKFFNVYPYPEGYREDVDKAPEGTKLQVLWQSGNVKPEFGTATKMGNTWYIQSDPNIYANGRQCATPAAWHPEQKE